MRKLFFIFQISFTYFILFVETARNIEFYYIVSEKNFLASHGVCVCVCVWRSLYSVFTERKETVVAAVFVLLPV